MAVATLSEAKAFANITSETSDAELPFFLDAATEAVEEWIGQIIDPRTFVEDHVVGWDGAIHLSAFPVISVTSVTTLDESSSWVTSLLGVDNVTGTIRATSGPALSGPVRVTFQAGKQVIPAKERMAILIVMQHLWETQRPTVTSAPGIGGFDDGGSSPVAGLAYAFPNRARELLGGRAPNRP